MREIIVYPDNTLCIDGKLTGTNKELLRRFGIKEHRRAHGRYLLHTIVVSRRNGVTVKAFINRVTFKNHHSEGGDQSDDY